MTRQQILAMIEFCESCIKSCEVLINALEQIGSTIRANTIKSKRLAYITVLEDLENLILPKEES